MVGYLKNKNVHVKKEKTTRTKDIISHCTLAKNATPKTEKKNIHITLLHVGSSLKNIKRKAKDLSKGKKDYKIIFCIFDGDVQLGYKDLKEYCKNNDKIFDASSVPTFEYWLYLHFKHLSTPITAKGQKTAGGMMLSTLQEILPTYEKVILTLMILKMKLKQQKIMPNVMSNVLKMMVMLIP